MTRYHNINGEVIPFTAEEEAKKDAEEAAFLAERTANKYKVDRTTDGVKIYPELPEQFDKLFRDVAAGKFGADAQTGEWYTAIKEVKDTNPKPS